MAQTIHVWNVKELNLEGNVRGDDFDLVLTLSEENKDYAGTTARMQARKTLQSDADLDIEAVVDTSTLGTCRLTFSETAANTTDLSGEYVYDVEIVIDGKKKTYVAGKMTFREDVTQ